MTALSFWSQENSLYINNLSEGDKVLLKFKEQFQGRDGEVDGKGEGDYIHQPMDLPSFAGQKLN